MRRIVTFNNVSADGYFSNPSGALDWVISDPDIAGGGASQTPRADTILFGRRTYQMFESFWPHALDESKTSPNPHVAGARSEAMRAMAVFINEATKIVFSRTLTNVTWKNSRIVSEFDAETVRGLKTAAGKDIMIFGSGSITSKLVEHGLIDEYQFVVNATLIGTGRSLISDVPKRTPLSLLEAKAYGTGNVVLRYAPKQ